MADSLLPELQRPTTFNFATDVVDYWAANPAPGPALHWVSSDQKVERKLSFEHFSRESHRIAVLFRQHLQVEEGARMLVILPRIPEWWEVATAAIRAGIVLCPAMSLLVGHDIAHRLQRTRATLFVGDAVSVAKVLSVRAECPDLEHIIQIGDSPPPGVINYHRSLKAVPTDARFAGVDPEVDRAAILYFTSGTSGQPKMVQHNAISYPLAHTITGKHWLRLTRDSLYWNMAEQGWGKAAWAYFGAWNCGAGLFVFDDRGAFSAERTLSILQDYPITTLCAPPTAYRQLVMKENQRGYDQERLKSLIHCVSAGEPLNAEVIKMWKGMTGREISEGYGQTECILVCGNFANSPLRPGSMGLPAPGVPLHVIDESGAICPAGVEGDMAIKIDDTDSSKFFGIFDGYLGEDGVLERRLKRAASGEDWYPTGDRAIVDDAGYFWFVGRSDDVINSAGYRIGPFEVESTLKEHSAVVESAAVSSPDPDRGEVVKVFIVLTRESANVDQKTLTKDLQDFCKKRAAPYKYPRKVQFVTADWLARFKTASGKTQRKRLKELEWQPAREKAKL